jgi:hypothetical protein
VITKLMLKFMKLDVMSSFDGLDLGELSSLG